MGGTHVYLGSLKMLPINLSNFKVFSKKIQRPLSLFWFFTVPVPRKIFLLRQFSRYRDAIRFILLKTKLHKNIWEQNFEFLPQIFFNIQIIGLKLLVIHRK